MHKLSMLLRQLQGLKGLSAPDELSTLQVEAKEAMAKLQREYDLHDKCNGAPQIIRLLGSIKGPVSGTVLKIVQEDVSSSLEKMALCRSVFGPTPKRTWAGQAFLFQCP